MNISKSFLVAILVVVTYKTVYGSPVLPRKQGNEATVDVQDETALRASGGRQEGSLLETSQITPNILVPVPEDEFDLMSAEEDDSENDRSKRFIIRIGGYPGYGGYGGYRGYRGIRRYRPHYHGYGRQYYNRW